MRRALLLLVMIGCTDPPEDPEAARLKKACEQHVCPDPKPVLISCMPIIPDDWKPLCEDPCSSFLCGTCGDNCGL